MFPWVGSTLVIHVAVSLMNPWESLSITACNGFQVVLIMAALGPSKNKTPADIVLLIWYAELMQRCVCVYVCMNVMLTLIAHTRTKSHSAFLMDFRDVMSGE